MTSGVGGSSPWRPACWRCSCVGRLATLPFALLLREQSLDYGLTDQSLAGWFADQGKGLAVSWVATTILVWVIVGAARRSPRYWFAWAGAAAMLVTVVGSALYPVVVEPLFNKFTPMHARAAALGHPEARRA